MNTNNYIMKYHSSDFKEMLTEVLNDTYWYENLGQFGTYYFWVKNSKEHKAIFANTLDEFNQKIYETISTFLFNREIKKTFRKRGKE